MVISHTTSEFMGKHHAHPRVLAAYVAAHMCALSGGIEGS